MISDVPVPGIPGLARPEVVGQGGYGTVYAAEEPEFGRRVAVKVLHERLDGAFALLHPDSDISRSGLEVWAKGQATTVIRSPVLMAVRDGDADGLEVDVAFTSTQSAELGPGGQTCTNWQLTYSLAGPAPGLLIRGARTITPPQAC